uniref:Large ribosomal subunit protein uL16m n=1 Tax=Viscum scurruloideum TaxID=1664545 RepID=A0A0H3WJ01_9MAGN|nr:ribosomal protein L16 [Viscum scurruloideum]
MTIYRQCYTAKNKASTRQGTRLAYGRYGITTTGFARISFRSLAAATSSIVHYCPKAKRWSRVRAVVPFTRKPQDVRMGRGKGVPKGAMAIVSPGQLLFELDGRLSIAIRAASVSAQKLCSKTKVVQ